MRNKKVSGSFKQSDDQGISRLNRVWRMLREEGAQSVSDIAAFNGFYHHSQFSADYKQLFGECPSETLGWCSGEVA
ncbi:AraC family transcriptional regulator [Marinobacter sp. NP-4(2019)]|uniref:helix-turn-helix domain-containing protein n=1 Tax=Marinobacter sp. NP-4(2019) TaxID=2488665 RepID=UPI000FC3EF18|nr:helix-turn-helix domain-containing protein [Marinobacter sp. NP-4(2019)]AZT83421.1 AraC family transcriptional regulator [Marinobacter sp. NP-4(2019)]